MYHVGSTEEDRLEADAVFLKNMILVIHNRKMFGFMSRLRVRAAIAFHKAVNLYGRSFFNVGKSILKIFTTE